MIDKDGDGEEMNKNRFYSEVVGFTLLDIGKVIHDVLWMVRPVGSAYCSFLENLVDSDNYRLQADIHSNPFMAVWNALGLAGNRLAFVIMMEIGVIPCVIAFIVFSALDGGDSIFG